MRSLTNIISNVFTGRDNVNFVHARVFCASILIFYCGMEWYAVVIRYQEFIPKEFALGIVEIVGLFAGHEYLTPDEPQLPPPSFPRNDFPEGRVP